MNIKKLFALLAGVSLVAQTVVPSAGVFAVTYTQEEQDAYNWAYGKSITTMSPIDNANMKGKITRAELAKMLANWAKSSEKVLNNTLDETKACEFTDTASVKGDLGVAIKESCQMGLMGQNMPNNAFRPYDTITRAEFGTALSRALWGNKYEGGTPWYKSHLQALKAAGIMNYIDGNWPSSEEVRGYVMIMLMRVENTDIADQGDDNENTGVVKSGELSITATSTESLRAAIDRASDLDTINFKASEAITLNSITLERYGYSTDDDVAGIWLENASGDKITGEKTLTKGKVTLNISKDYRNLSKNDVVTIVVNIDGSSAMPNGTIGFKVTDVNSSAKTVNIDNYRPYTYNYVYYSGADIDINKKDKDRTYHYVDGQSYVVSLFQVKPQASNIKVSGFTLKNNGDMKFDRYADKITVTVDGKAVAGLSTKVDRDDLVVSFNDIEIAAKQKALFKVEATLTNFDDLGKYVQFNLEEEADFKAVEVKNGARVNVYSPFAGYAYTFKGGKVTVTNSKLSATVDASQGATEVVVGSGNIEVPEAIKLEKFTISTDAGLDAMTMSVNGEDYDGRKVTGGFEFKNVEISKSGTIKFTVDVLDDDSLLGTTIKINSTFAKGLFGAKVGEYDESGEDLLTTEFVGSISLSNVKVQKAQGALENNNTSDVEFVTSESNRKVVFDGTFTANKQDVYLDTVKVSQSIAAPLDTDETITFYVFVDGKEVTSVDLEGNDDNIEEMFDDVLVKKGENVKVKVEAEVYATTKADHKYTVSLKGKDKDNNETDYVSDDTRKMMFVDAGSVVITDSTAGKNNVALAESNMVLAKFVVKPSNEEDEGIALEKAIMKITAPVALNQKDIRVKLNGVDLIAGDDFSLNGSTLELDGLSETLDKAGAVVEVSLKGDVTKGNYGDYELELSKVNETNVTKTFKRYVAPALVKVSKQENLGDETQYTFSVQKEDNNYTVENFVMKVGSYGAIAMDDLANGETDVTSNLDNVTYIDYVEYEVYDGNGNLLETVKLSKDGYKDYFRVDSGYVKIFKTSNN